jgi:hypothetical protein
MDITCWNCKTVTKLDKVAVEAAIAKMVTTKLGFTDIVCPSCGKSNRTTRVLLDAALLAFAAPASVESPLTKREATKKTKEENAKRRGDDVSKGSKRGKK